MADYESEIGDLVFLTLRRISREIDKRSRALMKQYGLTVPQLMIIKRLSEPGLVTVGALANAIGVSQATTTSILDRLERDGYVYRVRDTVDKRRVFVYTTDKSRELSAASPSIMQERFLSSLAELELWEQTQLLSGLQRIAAMIEADGVRDGA